MQQRQLQKRPYPEYDVVRDFRRRKFVILLDGNDTITSPSPSSLSPPSPPSPHSPQCFHLNCFPPRHCNPHPPFTLATFTLTTFTIITYTLNTSHTTITLGIFTLIFFILTNFALSDFILSNFTLYPITLSAFVLATINLSNFALSTFVGSVAIVVTTPACAADSCFHARFPVNRALEYDVLRSAENNTSSYKHTISRGPASLNKAFSSYVRDK